MVMFCYNVILMHFLAYYVSSVYLFPVISSFQMLVTVTGLSLVKCGCSMVVDIASWTISAGNLNQYSLHEKLNIDCVCVV